MHGFLGMFGFVDCTHQVWKICPIGWQCQYQNKDGIRSLIMEAIATKIYRFSMHIQGFQDPTMASMLSTIIYSSLIFFMVLCPMWIFFWMDIIITCIVFWHMELTLIVQFSRRPFQSQLGKNKNGMPKCKKVCAKIWNMFLVYCKCSGLCYKILHICGMNLP